MRDIADAASVDWRGAHAEIGEMLRTSVNRRFREQRSPEMWKWQPSFRALREGGSTLTLSARLRRSVKFMATAQRVDVGTNVVYAAIHNFGGQAGRGKKVTLPARPYMGISDGDERRIGEIIERRVTRSFK
ncbi:MAG: phage virion morphogenesis protein [Caulobacterales bacterium]|nr:phage virion morphogenesis protein [Caulobacterales bacterium]